MKILFIDGTAGFTPTRLQERPTGGILTSLTLIPRYLAAQGHDVTVMSCFEHMAVISGVYYLPITKNVSDLIAQDVVVFNRNSISRPLAKHFKANGARIIWWLHDICQLSYLQDDGFKLVDDIVALSDYCRYSYSEFYGIAHDKFQVIPNAVDPTVFYPGTEQRDRNLYIVASAAIKGLMPLEFTLHNMKRHNPDFELRVYSSQKLHDLENTASQNQALWALGKAGAAVRDPIPQHELAAVMRKAWCLLMPGHFPETNSNLVLQARACGLPVISAPIGSAREFIEDGYNGLLTASYPHDLHLWLKHYAGLCIDMQDPLLQSRLSRNAPEGILSWDVVGSQWNNLLSRQAVAANG